MTVLVLAPAAYEIEILERESERIHDRVARGAGWIRAVHFEPLADRVARQAFRFTRFLREISLDAGRRRRDGGAQDVLHDPLPAHDGRRAVRRGGRGEN